MNSQWTLEQELGITIMPKILKIVKKLTTNDYDVGDLV
jgi:hypothetical protein